jgi:hypothetical protein
MASNSKNLAELLNGDITVTATDIADGSVTTAKLADEAITTAKLNDSISIRTIEETIAKTSTDIFIYDTSKDSDGGAWRKRTQHTSWYNETLNTATRGSRREFPSIAVIVAESTDITIYDGDDPSLPMWMVFTFPNNGSVAANLAYIPEGLSYPASAGADAVPEINCISMLNGYFYIGNGGTGKYWNNWEVDFISDDTYEVLSYPSNSTTATKYKTIGNVSTRNSSYEVLRASRYSSNGGYTRCHPFEVAMTVLPNAPINVNTGLPVPSIAVNTAGGVSVIKDDGTVVSNTSYSGQNIAWWNDKVVASDHRYTNDDSRLIVLNYSDLSVWQRYGAISDGFNVDLPFGSYNAHDIQTTDDRIFSRGNNGFQGVIPSFGVSARGLTTAVTTTYSTGWMPGDISRATMMDTDDTNLTDSNLVTNGGFDNGTTGWSLQDSDGSGGDHANETPYVSSGQLIIGNTGQVTQSITTTAGKKYVVGYKCVNRSGGGTRMGIYISENSGSVYGDDAVANGEWKTYQFTATQTGGQTVGFRVRGGGWMTVDEVFCYEANESERFHGNDFANVGSITKTPITTGSDLVSYSGWNNSYLLSARNGSSVGMNYGTGDFTCAFWFKADAVGGAQYFLRKSDYSTSRQFEIWMASDLQYMAFYAAGSGTSTSQTSWTPNEWVHAVVTRISGTVKFYFNGVERHSASVSGSVDSTQPLRIGEGFDSDTHVALWKLGNRAMTADQVEKMYADEKQLFSPAAKSTLYGSNNQAYSMGYDKDTNLLHVGTPDGRSVFNGLIRVDNTTDAATAAISAVKGMVAED